ncbi:hypothetical protein HYC85_005896 [Camellia sinensis]|uniref:DNA-directed RNA polymerase III subunit RPC9 n=1 Tax=Camellia sinensis TaxID=4442 RepID=A0A7J7I299_CAMSI|nr:hypothetical protein HYC85_005896 [Camellia sinensis]
MELCCRGGKKAKGLGKRSKESKDMSGLRTNRTLQQAAEIKDEAVEKDDVQDVDTDATTETNTVVKSTRPQGRLRANAGALTNFEVLDFLRSRGAAKDPSWIIVPIAPSEFKVCDYLEKSVACIQTREIIKEFVKKCKWYKLAEAEILNIINIRPCSVVEIDQDIKVTSIKGTLLHHHHPLNPSLTSCTIVSITNTKIRAVVPHSSKAEPGLAHGLGCDVDALWVFVSTVE